MAGLCEGGNVEKSKIEKSKENWEDKLKRTDYPLHRYCNELVRKYPLFASVKLYEGTHGVELLLYSSLDAVSILPCQSDDRNLGF
ncbi:hypothetical protein ANN_22033 [Periplaneta americana]|uniref:Uncharacterized protein n=1 Tax=Periplaneta americana TaxID=6978 RepID=A0ABQ8S7I0_PERAM|nr:hypothetical protein ANN_22033 [Periplaneta americana]